MGCSVVFFAIRAPCSALYVHHKCVSSVAACVMTGRRLREPSTDKTAAAPTVLAFAFLVLSIIHEVISLSLPRQRQDVGLRPAHVATHRGAARGGRGERQGALCAGHGAHARAGAADQRGAAGGLKSGVGWRVWVTCVCVLGDGPGRPRVSWRFRSTRCCRWVKVRLKRHGQSVGRSHRASFRPLPAPLPQGAGHSHI